ncbi:S1 family peptidase [Argonema antarcticum]|uniref:S1 family peptidase n=1 Tax=Argonema antarcticum TaxID=2942763 RepID=UPI002010D323|nr:serine protease [Argonema antarcticum]MCL1471947.1 serine protease [Argonema antarcticum A004/B2]
MKFYDALPSVLAGTAMVSAIVVMQPAIAVALTGVQVNDIAREVTVLIRVEQGDGHGSGVIVAKDGNTYYVLTANHVVEDSGKYRIVTADKEPHELDYSKVKRLPGVDLAVVSFTSNKNYPVAKLANTETVKQGQSIFISGWPAPSQSITEVTRQFTPGSISSILETPRQDGYSIVYTSVTRRGMSGGPVLDTNGRVIGIHGLGDAETREAVRESSPDAETIASVADLIKSGFNLAIPINTFLRLAPQQNLYLALQVENSPTQDLTVAYTPPAQPDSRDRMDIKNIFGTLREGVDTFRQIRGIFGR